MYEREDHWYDDPPWAAGRDRTLDRLTHLVLVDGRLVDTWSEPVIGTRWQADAERFDRELRMAQQPAPVPPYERVLAWLDVTCGGRGAVLALDTTPLTPDGRDLPAVGAAPDRARWEATVELLDVVAEQWFDPETAVAFRRALAVVWVEEPATVTAARSPAQLAGGVCWAVGKANGLFRPGGPRTVARVQESLGTTNLSGYGQKVRSALRGLRHVPVGLVEPWPGPGTPHLEPLGRADLLLGTTREHLVRLRDRALDARAESAA